MTKTITLPSGEYMLVEVPEGSSGFMIIHNGTRLAWAQPYYKRIDIPQGGSIIGLASAIPEEICRSIVDYETYPMTDDIMYYTNYQDMSFSTCDTACKSLTSLVRSHRFEPYKCLIIKID